jgi:CRP/FNR family transcriptional regulator, cyclic AMP receptor protein
MKRTIHRKKAAASHLSGFASGDGLGGTVSRYRRKQSIYTQGEPASTLFYIEEGGVRLITRTKHHAGAVTAILGANDFFGELCLAGYPLRMSTAVALTASSIRTIHKAKMLKLLRQRNGKTSNLLLAQLLSSVKGYRDHVADLLTSSVEQRLARVLLQLVYLDKRAPPLLEIPRISQRILAEMVGTTRPRVNVFMNKFRKRGYINYDRGLEVHQSLRKVLRGR